jgi:imidazole glycerol-phosphate synthase subunit HisH
MGAPDIAVIDYGMGNLRSVCKALEAVGARARLVSDPAGLGEAAGIVFPGQGALGDCMRSLRRSGFDTAIKDWIADGRPYLGICLGLQALFERSEEAEEPGLGVFEGRVARFDLPGQFKIPHMGWNEARFIRDDSPLRKNLNRTGEQFYFVHSYYVIPEDPSIVLCVTQYGWAFVSAIEKGNCFATQFHPEKSQAKGLTIYRNFVETIGLPSGPARLDPGE